MRAAAGIVLGMILVLLAGPVGAEQPVLRIGYTEFPPYEYQNADGAAAGSYIDLTRQVAAEAGFRPEFVYLPVSRIYLYLKDGRIDLWPGLTGIPKLQGQVLASDTTPLHVELSAWHLATQPPIRQFDDLRNRRLILISGYTYGGLTQYLRQQPDIDLTFTSTHASAIDMLRRDRGDYLLDYRDPVEAVSKQAKVDGLQRSFVRERVAAWLFACQNKAGVHYRDAFDAAYGRLRDQGRLLFATGAARAETLPGFPALPVDRVPPKVMGQGASDAQKGSE